MKKIEILKSFWDFLSIDGFSKNYWGIYEEKAKNEMLKKGMKLNKKELLQFYNLYCYGYYNNYKQKLYYDILN